MREIPSALALPILAVLAAAPSVATELLLDDRLVGAAAGLLLALSALLYEVARRYRAQTALIEAQARAAEVKPDEPA